MLKLLGACCVIIATTYMGFLLSRSYADRPRQIRELRAALSLLETDIGYGSQLLADACARIGARHADPINQLFASMAEQLQQLDGSSTHECFQQALEDSWPRLALQSTERQILSDWSQSLGLSDRQDQLRHLQRVKTNLEVVEERARGEQEQYEKMFKTMGVLSGAFLIILMY